MLLEVCKIDLRYFEMQQMELIFCLVLMFIGISASKSKFNLHYLF